MKRLLNGEFLNTRHLPSRLAAVFSFIFAAIILFFGISVNGSVAACAVYIAIAVVFLIIAVIALMYNYGAYLKISGTHISARYAWRKRLECDIADVANIVWYTDVENPHTNRLVFLMRSGRMHTVRYLSNADEIGEYLSELADPRPNEPS